MTTIPSIGQTIDIDGTAGTVTAIQDFGSLVQVTAIGYLPGDQSDDPSALIVFLTK